MRPLLTGTGDVVLESSVGGFHIMELRGESWIIERGAYWASDDEIQVSAYRERMLNALWAGDGFIDFCTRVTGEGRVALTARGPTREVELATGETFAAEGKGVVIARSAEATYRVRRPARSLIGSWLSGERALRVFTGPGRAGPDRRRAATLLGRLHAGEARRAARSGQCAAPARAEAGA